MVSGEDSDVVEGLGEMGGENNEIRSGESTAERAAGRAVEITAERTVEITVERTAERTVERTVEITAEKTAEMRGEERAAEKMRAAGRTAGQEEEAVAGQPETPPGEVRRRVGEGLRTGSVAGAGEREILHRDEMNEVAVLRAHLAQKRERSSLPSSPSLARRASAAPQRVSSQPEAG